jgi:uncharacterized protein YdeI (YjbR/CyaY-like superfamily)
MPDSIRFFRSPAEFRAWLSKNHATATELWVGFRKKKTGEPSLTWPESVDEALCFGWIDGLRKSIDASSYKIRFSPRRPGSVWSNINICRVQELIKLKRIRPAGLRTFEARKENKLGIYSYENRPAELVEPYAGVFRRNKSAWKFFQNQPPYYRKTMTWWIVSAKRDETRLKRLAQLIERSAAGERIPLLKPAKKAPGSAGHHPAAIAAANSTTATDAPTSRGRHAARSVPRSDTRSSNVRRFGRETI